MAQNPISHNIEIVAIGVTENLDVSEFVSRYYIYTTAPVTLLGDVTITPTGTPTANMEYKFDYYGGVTLSTHSISIFGRNLLPNEALSVCHITAKYKLVGVGYTWVVDVILSDNAANEAKVKSDSADPTPGYLDAKISSYGLEVDVANHVIRLKNVTANTARKYFGTDGSGVWGLQDATSVIREATVVITDPQILAGFATPVQLLPAPGAGYYNNILHITEQTRNWTIPYATWTGLKIYFPGATNYMYASLVLASTVNRIFPLSYAYTGHTTPALTYIIPNTPLLWAVSGGVPTGGNMYNEIVYQIKYTIEAV